MAAVKKERKLKLVKEGAKVKGRDYPENFAFEAHGCDCLIEQPISNYSSDEEANQRALESI